MVQVCAGISHWTRIIIFCESRIKLKFIMNALYTKVESIHFRYPKSKQLKLTVNIRFNFAYIDFIIIIDFSAD